MSGCYILALSMKTEPSPSQTCGLSNIGFMIGLLLVAPEAWGPMTFPPHPSMSTFSQSIRERALEGRNPFFLQPESQQGSDMKQGLSTVLKREGRGPRYRRQRAGSF